MTMIRFGAVLPLILMGQLALAESASQSPADCSGPDAISISCGHFFFPVEGWAEYTAPDGSLRPVRKLRVYSVYYHDGAIGEDLPKVKVKSKRDGSFRFMAAVPHSTHEGCKDGKPYHNEIFLKEQYLLRAKGCDDLVLEVSKDWVRRRVQMHCPNRK